MNKLDALLHERTAIRMRKAQVCVSRIVSAAKARDVEIKIVGSFARKAFQLHSDIDFLVYGSAEPRRRAMIERMMADHMRGADIPYDLIFEADISPDMVQDLIHDCV